MTTHLNRLRIDSAYPGLELLYGFSWLCFLSCLDCLCNWINAIGMEEKLDEAHA